MKHKSIFFVKEDQNNTLKKEDSWFTELKIDESVHSGEPDLSCPGKAREQDGPRVPLQDFR